MSVTGRANRSGAEYAIRRIIEAYSKEAEMPQETCRNEFEEKSKWVWEIRLTKARRKRMSVKDGKRQRVIFSQPVQQILLWSFCWTHLLLGTHWASRSQQWVTGYLLAPETSSDPCSDNTLLQRHIPLPLWYATAEVSLWLLQHWVQKPVTQNVLRHKFKAMI